MYIKETDFKYSTPDERAEALRQAKAVLRETQVNTRLQGLKRARRIRASKELAAVATGILVFALLTTDQMSFINKKTKDVEMNYSAVNCRVSLWASSSVNHSSPQQDARYSGSRININNSLSYIRPLPDRCPNSLIDCHQLSR